MSEEKDQYSKDIAFITDLLEKQYDKDRVNSEEFQGSYIKMTLRFLQDVLQPDETSYYRLYRWEHSLRVGAYGKEIALAENMPVEPMVMACLLHDIGYFMLHDFGEWPKHADYSEIIARMYLKRIEYREDMVESMCYAIQIHDGRQPDNSHEPTPFELTVRDADDIDRWGAMRLGIIANSVIGENPVSEIRKKCSEKIENFTEDLNRICGTKTAAKLWEDRVKYQQNYYNRLKTQMELTEDLIRA